MEVVNKPWGWYKVLSKGDGYVLKELIVRPGQRLSKQYHEHRSEVWVCVAGRGVAEIDGEVFTILPGDMMEIPRRARHRLINDGPEKLVISEAWLGDDLREDDIVRIEDDYSR